MIVYVGIQKGSRHNFLELISRLRKVAGENVNAQIYLYVSAQSIKFQKMIIFNTIKYLQINLTKDQQDSLEKAVKLERILTVRYPT